MSSHTLVETHEVEDLTVEIHWDDDPMSPLEWDNLGTIVAFPRLSRDYMQGRLYDRESDHEEDDALARRDGNADLLERWLQMQGTEVVFFYAADYGSGGLRVWATDSENPSGFAYVDAATILKEYGDNSAESRERARACLRGEIETLGQYAEGDVYGYVINDADGEHIDSCWGFYGMKYAEEQALETAQWWAEKRRENAEQEAQEREHWANHDLSTEVTR